MRTNQGSLLLLAKERRKKGLRDLRPYKVKRTHLRPKDELSKKKKAKSRKLKLKQAKSKRGKVTHQQWRFHKP